MSDEAARQRVLEILEPALSDPTAGARRERVLAEDGRSDDEVRSAYAGLDAVVSLLRERLNGAGEEEGLPGEGFALRTDDDGLPVAADADAAEGPITRETPTRPSTRERLHAAKVEADRARHAAELLYDDVLWLFAINDGEGALVSLERLLNVGNLEGEVAEFIELNEERLLEIYENYIGPWSKVPRAAEIDPADMPAGYLDQGHLGRLHALVDGERSIRELIDASDLPPLRACAALEQLVRARIVTLED